MNTDEAREQVISSLTDILRTTPFSVEFKVVKKPTGIKIIHEVTQQQLDALMKQARQKDSEQ